jgi:uncharacterized protein YjbJ (UPF0337 family)
MKRSTNDRTKGKFHEVKGAIKEKVGTLTKDQELEAAGKAERSKGKTQGVIGRVEKAIGH